MHFWGKAPRDGYSSSDWHPLEFHSLDVAAVAKVLLDSDHRIRSSLAHRFDDAECLCSWLVFLLAIHDVGKFSDGFQNLRCDLFRQLRQRHSSAGHAVRHDSAGQALLFDDARGLVVLARMNGWLDKAENPEDQEDGLAPWVHAVTGHHGQPAVLSGHPLAEFFGSEAMGAATDFVVEVGRMFLANGRPPPVGTREMGATLAASSWWVAGLTTLCDWVGSNPAWFPFHPEPMAIDQYWRDVALPRARVAVRDAGLLPLDVSPDRGLAALFPGVVEPTPLQQQCRDHIIEETPCLYLIEDLPGAGKTEAAVLLAHRLMLAGKAGGLFIGLPTMATANAMFRRLDATYRNLYQEPVPSLMLAHGARDSILRSLPAHGSDDAAFEARSWLSDNRKKAFLSPIGVGTIDQALLGVLPVRHQSLRLLGIGRSVLVIDEVHSYQPYVHKLLCALLEFQATAGGCALLLSATLPAGRKAELVAAFRRGLGQDTNHTDETSAYPLLTTATRDKVQSVPVAIRSGMARDVRVEFVNDEEAARSIVLSRAEAGRCVCWIRNTVSDAVEAWRSLTDVAPKAQIRLFHARFPLADRLRIEGAVLEDFGKESTPVKRAGRILVATQVVEQSLDLDFDELVTDLAPIDLLIQRCGRLHRHDRPGRGEPVLRVFSAPPEDTPDRDWYRAVFPRAARVYPDHGRLWVTARLLADQRQIRFPDDMRRLLEAVYGQGADAGIPDALLEETNRAEGEAMAERAQARMSVLQVRQGYTPRVTSWFDEGATPTRLSDPTVRLRLVDATGTEWQPYGDRQGLAWESGDVSVRKILVDAESPEIDAKQLEMARSRMPDMGRWSIVVPVCRTPEGYWSGFAGRKDKQVVVTCDPVAGVSVGSKEG